MAIPTYLRLEAQAEGYILIQPEYRNFSSEVFGWKIETRKSEIFGATISFFSWYLDYCASILKGKTYEMDHVVPHLFRDEVKTNNQRKEFLGKSIYVSSLYVGHLHWLISMDNIQRYQHSLMALVIDLEHLIIDYEELSRKSIDKGSYTSGRRKDLSPTDILFAARSLFWIEEREKIEDLYLRDVKPVVIFQIRQIIELFGRNLVGYYEIRKVNGGVNKRVTQEAWKFITEEVKGPNSRIHLPFNVDMINQVSDWANRFVHTTFLYSSYIQFYALEVLNLLFKGSWTPIKIHSGLVSRRTDIADITITRYESLKLDFEKYLTDKLHQEVKIEWQPVSKVGAYVLDLGMAERPHKAKWWRRWLTG